MTNIRIEKDAEGIVTIIWDMPGRSMNVISQASDREFKAACEAAIADKTVKGVVITSAKPAFIAGADLSMMEGALLGFACARYCGYPILTFTAYVFKQFLWHF